MVHKPGKGFTETADAIVVKQCAYDVCHTHGMMLLSRVGITGGETLFYYARPQRKLCALFFSANFLRPKLCAVLCATVFRRIFLGGTPPESKSFSKPLFLQAIWNPGYSKPLFLQAFQNPDRDFFIPLSFKMLLLTSNTGIRTMICPYPSRSKHHF